MPRVIRADHPNYEMQGRPVRVARKDHECDSLICYRELGEVHYIGRGFTYVQLSAHLKFCKRNHFTDADVVAVPQPEVPVDG